MEGRHQPAAILFLVSQFRSTFLRAFSVINYKIYSPSCNLKENNPPKLGDSYHNRMNMLRLQ